MENQKRKFFYGEHEYLQMREQINELGINMMYHKSHDYGIAFATWISLKVFDPEIDGKSIYFKNNSMKMLFRNIKLI